MACGVALAAAPGPRLAANRPGALAALAVPGGADAIAAAAGLPVPAPRATVALEVIRRLHGGAEGDLAAAARRQAVAQALTNPGQPPATIAGDTIPLPFDEALWARLIFRRAVTPAGLATAILTTRPGAWFYYGAVGLDDETRAWFRARPHRLLKLSAQAGAFAAFGPSVHVRAERVAASPADADTFIDKLMEARAGRIAWLYDTVGRLEPALQKHPLEGDGALERMRRLADVFA